MVTGRAEWLTLSIRNYSKNGMTKIHMGHLEEIIEVDVQQRVKKEK
jgi:hypothetical protein